MRSLRFCIFVYVIPPTSFVLWFLLLASTRGHEFEEERRPQRAQVDGQLGQSSRQNDVIAPLTNGPQNRLSHVCGVTTCGCVFIQY